MSPALVRSVVQPLLVLGSSEARDFDRRRKALELSVAVNGIQQSLGLRAVEPLVQLRLDEDPPLVGCSFPVPCQLAVEDDGPKEGWWSSFV